MLEWNPNGTIKCSVENMLIVQRNYSGAFRDFEKRPNCPLLKKELGLWEGLRAAIMKDCNFVIRFIGTNSHIPTPEKRYTMRGFDKFELHEDGTMSLPNLPSKPQKVIRTMVGFGDFVDLEDGKSSLVVSKNKPQKIERWLDPNLRAEPPRTCTPEVCPIQMCSWKLDQEQWGKPCKYYVAANKKKSQVDPLKVVNRGV